MRVLVIDDDAVSTEMVRFALSEFGYEVTACVDAREGLQLARSGEFPIVILDWEMPDVDGLQICREIRNRVRFRYTYIILLTSRAGTENIIEGLEAGADEFLCKPFNPQELFVRLRVARRVLALESRDVTIFSLAKLAESRDPETGAHLERMREYCRILATWLSRQPDYEQIVDANYVETIYLTSPLHDIGKVGIPDRVLLKEGPLSDEEFAVMKRHTLLGADTLDAAASLYPDAQYLTMARDIAISHHEKFDGSGYPFGLVGDEIPLCGRIVAVADVYDALTTKRVYKPAFTHPRARRIIVAGSGVHFDPIVVRAFCECEQEFLDTKQRLDAIEAQSAWPLIGKSAGIGPGLGRRNPTGDREAPVAESSPARYNG
ncbi:MAG: response regulator [Pirellulales bacterium]